MNIEALPKHFDTQAAEIAWQARWSELGVYRYAAAGPGQPRFAIDTPPPTVSGSLHVGHVFSYTQTDLVARFHRMCGKSVFYPMGWDDNGLPTERRVQNYFHVRCNPSLKYEPNLELTPQEKIDPKSPPREISRSNFIELCLRLTQEDEKSFKDLWGRLGLSVDWKQEYSTIDPRCQRAAQRSFLDLWRKGHIYSVEAPTMWDVDFQTAVAQAEVEDRNVAGAFHHVRFGVEGSPEIFTIATTRPELLPACVGVTAHPDDARYKHLFGKRALTPLFGVPVPIFPSELADPEKGTGILMVCTFGDATDVRWWREQNLANRQILGRNGRLLAIEFGDGNWPSIDPARANTLYAEVSGRNVKQARRIIVEQLRQPDEPVLHGEPPLEREPAPLEHPVKFFEKGDQPLEFITTRQFFVRLLNKKPMLIDAGDRIQWHPEFMRHRYRIWTENLAFDWAISRQRYFGVPFPVWYPINAAGEIDYDHPIVADESRLPLDPADATPPNFTEALRGKPGGFIAESDVFDTWFTSSLTPMIASGWGEDPDRFQSLFPMDLRPQSHEIIRTWAFYTVAKALLHEGQIPWKNVAISGWILDPDRKKMSKSKGNVITPMHLLDEYGSDAVRYWAAGAQLGADTAFDVNVLKVGKRLVTKLFNASKFVLGKEGAPGPITYPMDRVFLVKLRQLVRNATRHFENYEHQQALAETERFFWTAFTDSYIEMSRARTLGVYGPEAQGSALATLRIALSVFLRLFAPFLPYITDEVWSWSCAAETGSASIHAAAWPSDSDFPDLNDAVGEGVFDVAVEALYAINKSRAGAGVSSAREIKTATLAAKSEVFTLLKAACEDIRLAVRANELLAVEEPQLDGTGIEVRQIEFVSAEATGVAAEKS
ncbi:MAG TPA: valine--tRNA ligase [Terracidiphilus sp.]|nr:valine--tRNA ligase [Terracidiphilus sp.]